MNESVRKLLRTIQSEFWFLKDAKDTYYRYSRRLMSRPHEMEYRGLRFVPDALPGCYVDVGANHGQSIESIKVFKPNARIYSFEANTLLADKLRLRYGNRTDITVFPYGLADEDRSLTLYVPVYKNWVYDGDASFDRQSAATYLGPDRLYWFSPEKLQLREMVCTSKRLDEQKLDPIFVKLDVQGYECQVVKGGIETIKRYEPILIVEGLYGNPELVRTLQDLGYEEFFFDDTGFYKSSVKRLVNSLLMTPKRAQTVRLSDRTK